MKQQGQSFLSRVVTNSLLFYFVVWLYDPSYLNTLHSNWDKIVAFLLIGVIFSLLNAVVKPILAVLTLPAVFLTMGLFMLVINGVIVYLTAALIPNLELGFGTSILAGIVISAANYIITNLFEIRG